MAPFGVRQFRQLLGGCVSISVVTFVLSALGSVLSGHFLGETALTGVALASPLFTFCGFLSALIGVGTAINYSRRRGALDRDGAESVFMQGVWTVLFCGVATGLASWVFRDSFIGLMTDDPAVVRCATDYWRWLPFGLVLVCFSGLLYNCCYCDGETLLPTLVTCGQCGVTLGVSTLLLRRGHGVESCSAGFTSGYLFACLALSLHFIRRSNTFRFRWRFRLRDSWIIVRTSAADALGFLGDSVIYVTLGYVLSRSFGPAALLGLPVFVFVSEGLSYANGFAAAMQPIIAVYVGEGNHRSVMQVFRSIFCTLAAVSLVVTIVLLVFPGLVLTALGVSDPSAVSIVRTTALMILPMTLLNLMNNYFQLIEREAMATGLTLFCWFVLPLAALGVFPRFGADGFWYWSAATRWGGMLLFAGFLALRYGRRRFPWLLDRDRIEAISTVDLHLEETEIVSAAEKVAMRLLDAGKGRGVAMKARLLVEESLMVIRERNAGRSVRAEVTLDLGDGVVITLRDDGIIFDITDTDVRVSGLRTYLVARMMHHQSEKSNILTTGFNRNVFRL